jgi:DNA repair exonuclease SbcCD ATPase subunit
VTRSERLQKLREDIAAVKANRDVLRIQMSTATAFIASARHKAELNQKGAEVIKNWLEDLLRSNVDSIASLVTTALRHIIYDQQLTFRIIQEPKYNRLAMRFSIEEDGVEADPMSSFGGGAAVVASFVLRVAIMARLKMSNLLLLDESMFALANRYVPSAADFMKQLSEETGINIFMVTHNDEFMSNAHLSYEGYVEQSPGEMKSLRLRRRT